MIISVYFLLIIDRAISLRRCDIVISRARLVLKCLLQGFLQIQILLCSNHFFHQLTSLVFFYFLHHLSLLLITQGG